MTYPCTRTCGARSPVLPRNAQLPRARRAPPSAGRRRLVHPQHSVRLAARSASRAPPPLRQRACLDAQAHWCGEQPALPGQLHRVLAHQAGAGQAPDKWPSGRRAGEPAMAAVPWDPMARRQATRSRLLPALWRAGLHPYSSEGDASAGSGWSSPIAAHPHHLAMLSCAWHRPWTTSCSPTCPPRRRLPF